MNRLSHLQIRFSHDHKRALYAIFLTLWLSGALWLLFHYFLQAQGDFGPQPHPLQQWWLRLHGLAAFATLVAIGSVLPIHARRAWQLKKNRASGLSMKVVSFWLAITGYALYYFSSDDNAAWLPMLHWIVGLALPLLLVLHIKRGRSRAKFLHKPVSAQR